MKPIVKPKRKRFFKAKVVLKRLWRYFNILPDKEREADTISCIGYGVQFRGANLWVLIFAILIASLGLNVNSTAVIIGAMLISPLMGPILGGGLALGIKDYVLLRRSVKNYGVATLISVVTATVYFFITPFDGAQSELLARTSPTLYDVLIAFFGGMAGVMAVCTRGKGNVIPGVAIATALMPPLCTAGYGLANGNWAYFLGAFYLFFINTIFIGLATFIGVKMLRFNCIPVQPNRKYRKIGRYIAIGVVISLVPAAVMTYRIVSDTFFEKSVVNYISKELDQKGTEILAHNVDKEKQIIEVIAVGRNINDNVLKKAKERLPFYKMEDYTLEVIQGEQGDSLLRVKEMLQEMDQTKESTMDLLNEKTEQVLQLTHDLNQYTRFLGISENLREEILVLFPAVRTLNLSVAETIQMDTTAVTPSHTLVVVQLRNDSTRAHFVEECFKEWLGVRIKDKALQMVVVTDEAIQENKTD